MPRAVNWGPLIKRGKKRAHQPSRIESSSYGCIEWKLNPSIFQKLRYVRGRAETDLFATRVTTQLQAYISWRTDHLSQGTNAFQQSWKNLKTYAISPLFPNESSSEKSPERASKPSSSCIQACYPCLLHISIKNQNFVAKVVKLFKKYSRGKSPISPKQIYAVGGMDSIYAVGGMAKWCSGYCYCTASFV